MFSGKTFDSGVQKGDIGSDLSVIVSALDVVCAVRGAIRE